MFIIFRMRCYRYRSITYHDKFDLADENLIPGTLLTFKIFIVILTITLSLSLLNFYIFYKIMARQSYHVRSLKQS